MGRIEKTQKISVFDFQIMKVLSAIFAAALAEEARSDWNGYIRVDPTDGTEGLVAREITNCGTTISTEHDMRNATCKITYDYAIYSVYAGNGAFIDKKGDLTGFDETSSTVQLVVEYKHNDGHDGKYPADLSETELEEFYLDPQRNNASCWGGINIDCTDNGSGSSETMFMETINADKGADNYNFQIANYGAVDTVLIVQINDNDGNGVQLSQINSTQGVVIPGNNGEITFNILDDAPLLFQFSAYADRTPNLFLSEVTSN